MRKNKQETTEYIPELDAATYHTGATKPPKKHSGLFTALLVIAIVLGGLASALGIVNFRLLAMMANNPNSITPLDTKPEMVPTTIHHFLDNQTDPIPSIPKDRHVELLLQLPREDMTPDEIYCHNEQALVSVYCTTHGSETLSGTGIVISADGYIVTNAHILEAAQRVFVYLANGTLVRAAIVGTDPFTDLAVLYVQADQLQPALFVESHHIEPDMEVHALKDQPDSDHNFILSGAVYERSTLSVGDLTVSVLQSTLWANSGPVFDSQGRIVACLAGKISRYFQDNQQSLQGISIPTETMWEIVEALITDGHVQGRPAIGIQVEAISKLYQHYWDLPGGLLVTQLEKGSNADLQGLKEGDILLTLDGIALTSRADLYAAVFQAQIGDELIAAVFRDGRNFTITLTVEKM